MTRTLKEAFNLAESLPEEEQEALAHFLIEEIEGERRWIALFAGSGDLLNNLVQEAKTEFSAGRTTPLEFD
ncbi:MAG: hypothetical protein HYV26_12440 [Candidatus Hydrogenedentes bacterium]|nr:hypothetical protein [Candidatus Hydrogenedentota bacterium]